MNQPPAYSVQTAHSWNTINWSSETLPLLQTVRAYTGSLPLKTNPRIKGKQLPFRFLFEGRNEHMKILAAALVGKDASKNVYRIDLDTLISKYIGETEKNLQSLLQSVSSVDILLLFDEADALFGKKHADQETVTDDLLKITEMFPGTIIFSCTSKSDLDKAFIRRMQAIVFFP